MGNLEGIVNENFLSNQECDHFIEYHKENFILERPFCKLHRTTKVIQCMELLGNPIIKKLYKKLVTFAKDIDPNITVNYFEIVRWPTGESQSNHVDFDYHPHTSIIYLNDDFKGGITRVGDVFFKPKKGTLISFEGCKINHEVLKITEGERYTIPCWYRLETNV
jgi:hypothetical protein